MPDSYVIRRRHRSGYKIRMQKCPDVAPNSISMHAFRNNPKNICSILLIYICSIQANDIDLRVGYEDNSI